MKNIYKISFIAIIATLFFNSCAIDDDPAVLASKNDITVVSLDKNGEHYVFPSAGDEITINVVLSQAILEASQITLKVNGVDQTVVLNAGDTSIPVTVQNTIGAINTVELSSAIALNTKLSLGTHTAVKFISVQEPTEGSINLSLSLSDTSGALVVFTFAVFDGNGTWTEDLFGGLGTTLEIPINSTITNSTDLAPSYYAIDIFSQPLDSPNYEIFAVFPDGSVEVFSGSDLSQEGFVDNDVVLINVADSSVSGQKEYTLTQN